MTINYLAKLPRSLVETYLMQSSVARATGAEITPLGVMLADVIHTVINEDQEKQELARATKQWPGEAEMEGAFVSSYTPNPDFDFTAWNRNRIGYMPKSLEEAKQNKINVLNSTERVFPRQGAIYGEAKTLLSMSLYDKILKTQFKNQKAINSLYENADYCPHIIAHAINEGIIPDLVPHSEKITSNSVRIQILRNMSVGVVPANKENSHKAQQTYLTNEPYMSLSNEGTRIAVLPKECLIECDIDATTVQEAAAKARYYDVVLYANTDFQNILTTSLTQAVIDETEAMHKQAVLNILPRPAPIVVEKSVKDKPTLAADAEPVVVTEEPVNMYTPLDMPVVIVEETLLHQQSQAILFVPETKEEPIPVMAYATTPETIFFSFNKKFPEQGKEFCQEVVSTKHGKSALSLAYALNFPSKSISKKELETTEYNTLVFKEMFAKENIRSVTDMYAQITGKPEYALYDNEDDKIVFTKMPYIAAKDRMQCLLLTSALLVENGMDLIPHINMVDTSVIQSTASHYKKAAPKVVPVG